MDLFWRKGYGATTPADLSEALGIGKGSLYNAFDSKHGLFVRALRRYGDERVASLEKVLGRAGSVTDRLRAALERLAAPEIAHLRRRGCLAVNTTAEVDDDTVAAIVRSVFDRMEHALQKVIEEGQERGELAAAHDARALASLFVTTLIGMTVIGRTADRSGRMHRAIGALLALVS